MNETKFFAQKVLNMKQQDGRKMVLVQWEGFGVQEASWQHLDKFNEIEGLIHEYQKSKVNDKVKNFALKQTQKIDCGQNPYKETSRHGHFMYGDQPQKIESIKVFKNQNDDSQKVTVICEIKWKDRIQYTELGNQIKQINVIVENSFIDSKIVNEYRPHFLVEFYQDKISLNYQGFEDEGKS